MNRLLIWLALVLGPLVFVGPVVGGDHHRHDHRPPLETKTDKAHKPRGWTDAKPKIRTITGRVSATEERARADARRALEVEIAQWLAPEVPSSRRPDPLGVEAMIVDVRITPTEKPYGTVHTAEIDANFSDSLRAELIHSYDHVLVRDRLLKLGGLFAFVLVSLAAITGFIRADEATKGYYTNSLRLATAVGVGAAGVLIYQWLA